MSVCGYEEVEGLFKREREREREKRKKKNCHINQFEEAETSFVSASSSIHLEIISTCIKFRTYLFFAKKLWIFKPENLQSVFLPICVTY